MKKIILIIAILLPVIYYGCKSDSIIGPLTNNIEFTFSKGEFSGQPAVFFKPSEDVKIKTIRQVTNSTPSPIDETITLPNPDYIYSKETSYVLITGNALVVSGYLWTFYFNGNKSSNNEVFNFSKDYTIP